MTLNQRSMENKYGLAACPPKPPGEGGRSTPYVFIPEAGRYFWRAELRDAAEIELALFHVQRYINGYERKPIAAKMSPRASSASHQGQSSDHFVSDTLREGQTTFACQYRSTTPAIGWLDKSRSLAGRSLCDYARPYSPFLRAERFELPAEGMDHLLEE